MSHTLTELFTSEPQRWQALVERNPAANGQFFYAVKTTGIYCRPTCPSRRPHRTNVTFFATCAEAEQAGFRPCKRCKPDAPPQTEQVETMTRICALIEQTEEPLSLQTLAEAAGLSPYHFHRLFKKIVGITPKAYAIAHRQRRIRQELHREDTVTQAIYQAGFESSSSFYNQSTALLGMTPMDYKQGAPGVSIRFAVRPCWLGWILVAATALGICAIAFDDTPEALTTQLQQQFPNASFEQDDPGFAAWVDQVLAFVEAPQQGLNLPLDIQGTAFQQQVWQALQTIPVGSTMSYSEVAERIGNPKAVRAVARACATNPLAVAVPCHRVVSRGGDLSGYRWGRDRKQALLTREAQGSASGQTAQEI